MTQVVKVFKTLHTRFLGYMKATSMDQQVRFAKVWNKIINSMRDEVSYCCVNYYSYLIIHYVQCSDVCAEYLALCIGTSRTCAC
jgi:hypothetical protein